MKQMKSSPSYKIYMLLLLLLIFLIQTQVADSIFDKFQVHIINGLTNNTVGLHCKSKKEDLGHQELAVNGEFVWKFKVNFWGTTLYFCSVWWNNGHKTFDAFTADEQGLLKYCCTADCIWRAREDGMYLYNCPKRAYEIVYKWEPWK